jgi:hypothetical protein
MQCNLKKIKKIKSMGLNKRIPIVLAISLLFFVGCESNDGNSVDQSVTIAFPSPTGVLTTSFEESKYSTVIYVNALSEDSVENGSKKSPFKSITTAINNSTDDSAIVVAQGNYSEGTLQLTQGITLLGGFNAADWSRDVSSNETILSGKDQNRILIVANNTTIDGFTFSKGVYRGAGAAIYSKDTSSIITNNVFTENVVLGPLNWNPDFLHEMANNGGAIYGENGASSTIKNNVFFNNSTENGRGAAIAFDNKCNVIINNNVFVNNVSGTNDPMRSSDGGGISIFNWCDAEISNNVFLGNKALARNDGGAVFVALWSSARINNNILVNSESGDDAGALFVGGQEHRYGGLPLDPIPSKEQFYVTIDNNQFYGNKNSSMNSGAMRFTMESRGEFSNNRLAFNNGIYFQRSEVAVKNNIIFDNFLFLETKKGLKQGSIEGNIIWGDFKLRTTDEEKDILFSYKLKNGLDQFLETFREGQPKVSGNLIRDGYDKGENNLKGIPNIKADGKTINVVSTTINKNKLKTHIFLSSGNYKENELVNKTVRSGDKWGVVQSNYANVVTVWGDLFGVESIQLLPSYTIID